MIYVGPGMFLGIKTNTINSSKIRKYDKSGRLRYLYYREFNFIEIIPPYGEQEVLFSENLPYAPKNLYQGDLSTLYWKYPQCWGNPEFGRQVSEKLAKTRICYEHNSLITNFSKPRIMSIERDVPNGVCELKKSLAPYSNVWLGLTKEKYNELSLIMKKVPNRTWRDLLVDFLFAEPSELEESVYEFIEMSKYSEC